MVNEKPLGFLRTMSHSASLALVAEVLGGISTELRKPVPFRSIVEDRSPWASHSRCDMHRPPWRQTE